MKSTVPADKFARLKEAFPDLFSYFFDAGGCLNAQGRIAEELLAKRELLSATTFMFDPDKEVLLCCVSIMPVSGEAHPSALMQMAEAFLEGNGLSGVSPKLATA